MVKPNKTALLTFAERCKNILASNWIATLNTIKADANGSKENIHTSKVKYMIRKGRPYIWVPEKDFHNVNTIIDERSSLAVASPFPGPLASLFKSLEKLPPRVALVGDMTRLKSEKAQDAVERLKAAILFEQKAIEDFGSLVSNILKSSKLKCTSRSQHLKEILNGNEEHVLYKFDVRSSMYIDSKGGMYEVEAEHFTTSKADSLTPFSAVLIDGINQNATRRRALMLFCLVYFNANAKDAYIVSVDRKGFELLGKVPILGLNVEFGQYEWKDFRFTLKNEAKDIGDFCQQLLEMEEEVVKRITSYSGLG
ncbi:hypothetical protein IC582_020962 [Cucumis melo]|uniref:Uncharacterized protein LOC103498165 n=3 Tax=Cucumis melo TaxID=3656 RepID=A0A1S3C9H6_CUCME|nr:uncharacterized protein LOC103498165 isoform X1 [Cucumis melo]XP_008458896.1 uncharacterized protein LOC103498165 isoform X1 [Cucumis melo]XP_050945662.1 uncharacterized protein LOC103498165 isoform X1 [Cucumis melo]KAA0042493.1 FMN-binding split barrel [Cucumis melo var. makuwa]TYK22881.1 FMN-binding split barrel [Cucumis melo var. makuwa]